VPTSVVHEGVEIAPLHHSFIGREYRAPRLTDAV
jgi:hypothetical protein